jgi:acetyl-CoA acetyltransferase
MSVSIAGVGMSPFTTPSQSVDYVTSAAIAINAALRDAGIEYRAIQTAIAGYVYGDSTCGQRAIYPSGMTGIPIINVNNNCSTGSSALYLARQLVAGGGADCVLALGFEQMRAGALASNFDDRPNPLRPFEDALEAGHPIDRNGVMAAQLFGHGGLEHMRRFGTRPETFAKIAVKARRHAEHNERAVFRTPLTLDEVLGAKPVFGPLTRLQCCPPTSGAAAAIVVSQAFARRHGLSGAVPIRAQAMTTDKSSSFGEDPRHIVGYAMAQAAADAVYESAGIGPSDLDVVELHDCFTANELLSYEALSLVEEGGAERFVEDGDNSYGGRIVTNPSGGLLSKGHPLGATGLAQCAELVWQLRGQAGVRQVEGARLALQHNLGLGGACVVTLYGAPHA